MEWQLTCSHTPQTSNRSEAEPDNTIIADRNLHGGEGWESMTIDVIELLDGEGSKHGGECDNDHHAF